MTPYTVGITGSLGTGKSTVCRRLARRGLPVLDADRLSRELTAPGSAALAELVRHFGADIVDAEGRLERAVLARRALADEESQRRLNEVLHPRIRQRLADEVERLGAAGHAAVVIEAALILESGHRDFYDLLVVVVAPDAVKIERAVARGLEAADARRRLARQWPDARKMPAADWVIENGGSLAELEAAVDRLADEIVRRAARGGDAPGDGGASSTSTTEGKDERRDR